MRPVSRLEAVASKGAELYVGKSFHLLVLGGMVGLGAAKPAQGDFLLSQRTVHDHSHFLLGMMNAGKSNIVGRFLLADEIF